MKSILKKISCSVLANVLSAVISVLTILVLPKVMSMEDYGVWQLFLFYFSYVGFFHFGWIDGIYLRYGGYYYEDLDKRVFSGQFLLFIMLLALECFISNLVIFSGLLHDGITVFLIQAASFAGPFFCITTFVNFTLQLSNRIKEYAFNIIIERLLTILLIMLFIFLGFTDYHRIIYVKVISCALMASYSVYVIKDLVLSERCSFRYSINQALSNISAGSKLMLSNVAAMLVLGIIRFGISRGWDVITFGKISLSLQVSHFLMLFISAISIVLFPILKRMDCEKIKNIYIILRRVLSLVLLGLLMLYYPLKSILEIWLPRYKESLIFMGYLLPFCVFESTMQMLVNTYLKSLREEYLMLKINVCSVAFAILSTYITVTVMHNLCYAVLAIVANFAFRLFVAERFVELLLKIDLLKERICELIVVIAFIFLNYNQFSFSPLIYLCIYFCYLFINKGNIVNAFGEIRTKLGK